MTKRPDHLGEAVAALASLEDALQAFIQASDKFVSTLNEEEYWNVHGIYDLDQLRNRACVILTDARIIRGRLD